MIEVDVTILVGVCFAESSDSILNCAGHCDIGAARRGFAGPLWFDDFAWKWGINS